MKKQVVLDTGPLVALLDARDRHHKWSVAQWADIEPPLLTCESVISEACFLLDQTSAGSAAVFEMLVRKVVALSFHLDEQLKEVQALRRKYSDVPMSVADASLVRMAEQFSRSAVLTLDGDFKVYRKHGRYVIPLILPAETRRP
ncbi:MAG TPA: PIN domain-containing protein [Vicinamibacterales bacterium]|nr:PIN domain-containing protein [Vicinamibacterales bacterium]